jgi:hypothetical protein
MAPKDAPNSKEAQYKPPPWDDAGCIFQMMIPSASVERKRRRNPSIDPVDYDVRLYRGGGHFCSCPGFGWRYRNYGEDACHHLHEIIAAYVAGEPGSWRAADAQGIWPPPKTEDPQLDVKVARLFEEAKDDAWASFYKGRDNFEARMDIGRMPTTEREE